MEEKSDLILDTLKEKFSNKEVSQEDIDQLNAVPREERETILKAIPDSEDVFSELCIDEDINGNLFFIRAES